MQIHLGCSVVAAGDQIVAGALLKLDPGDQLGVGGDGVLDVPLPEVPHLAAVVLTAGHYTVTIWRPISSCNPLQVSLKNVIMVDKIFNEYFLPPKT